MLNATHHILRQVIELEINAARTDHRALTERLSRLGTIRIPALTEALLAEYDLPGQVIRLDQVTVELTCDTLAEIDNMIETEFSAALQEALRKALDTLLPQHRQPTALADLEILHWLLLHGYLPWHTAETLTLAELEYRVTEALAAYPASALSLAALLRQPMALQRLLRQFSGQMPWRIATALRPDFETAFPSAWISQWVNVPGETAALIFWQIFFDDPTATPQVFMEKITAAAVAVKIESPAPAAASTQAPDTGIFIENAGLILLHPFLPNLFEALGIATDGKINDPDKALFALHFAATGQTTAPEWALTLPKIMGGIPLNRPLWRTTDLTDAEQTEISQMLQACIGHWGALGNTAISGLREGFLQRKGRLIEGSETWTLKVESQSYDMLLEQLPWSLSMIKLPWMNKLLYTEWA